MPQHNKGNNSSSSNNIHHHQEQDSSSAAAAASAVADNSTTTGTANSANNNSSTPTTGNNSSSNNKNQKQGNTNSNNTSNSTNSNNNMMSNQSSTPTNNSSSNNNQSSNNPNVQSNNQQRNSPQNQRTSQDQTNGMEQSLHNLMNGQVDPNNNNIINGNVMSGLDANSLNMIFGMNNGGINLPNQLMQLLGSDQQLVRKLITNAANNGNMNGANIPQNGIMPGNGNMNGIVMGNDPAMNNNLQGTSRGGNQPGNFNVQPNNNTVNNASSLGVNQEDGLSGNLSRMFNVNMMQPNGQGNNQMMNQNMMNRNVTPNNPFSQQQQPQQPQQTQQNNNNNNLGWTQGELEYLKILMSRHPENSDLVRQCFPKRSPQDVQNRIQVMVNEMKQQGIMPNNNTNASTPTAPNNVNNKRPSISMPSPGNDQAKRVKTDSPVNKSFNNTTGTPSSPSTVMVSNSNPNNSNPTVNKQNQNINPSTVQSERYIQTLLQSNTSLITDIKANIDQRKISANVPIINKFRDNIIQILTCMSMMEGIMSQMPPIPVKLSTICVPKNATNITGTGGNNQQQPNQQPQPSQQNIVTTPNTPQDGHNTFQNMLASSNGGPFMMNKKM